jgi:hypothetical protein
MLINFGGMRCGSLLAKRVLDISETTVMCSSSIKDRPDVEQR